MYRSQLIVIKGVWLASNLGVKFGIIYIFHPHALYFKPFSSCRVSGRRTEI